VDGVRGHIPVMSPHASDPSDLHTRAQLERYLAGECLPEEVAHARALLQARPGVMAAVHELHAQELVVSEDDIRKSWHSIQRRMVENSRTPLHGVTAPRRNSYLVAALVVLVAVTATLRVMGPRLFERSSARTSHTYATIAGQRATVQLADGSEVVLAPMTTLVETKGELNLTGEAFFTVAHHDATPFVVRTGQVTTTVLGTAFDVRYDARSHQTRVAVLEGKVATGSQSRRAQRVTVSADMMAIVGDSSDAQVSETDVKALAAWRDGRLVFHDAPVPDVLQAIGRWYGVTLTLTDSVLRTRHLTTTIDVGLSQAYTLSALSAALGVQYRAVGDTIVLVPRIAGRDTASAPIRRALPSLTTYPAEAGR